jgi:AAA family ATP:ADP antiporter
MESLTDRLLGRLTNTRRGEHTVALLMFAYSFLAMTAYNIFKPVSRSKFIDQLGSDNLPYVLMASSVLIGILMHGYAGAVRRVPRQHVIPVTQAALVALLLTFWVLLETGAVWVTVALYFFGQVFGILLISQFWTLANDVYDARQAKRLFGLIGGGACLGGAMGNTITFVAARQVGSNNLLVVSAVVLSVCVGIVVRILRTADVAQHTGLEEEQGAGGGEAIRLLTQSRHLRVLAAVVGCAAVGAAVVEQQFYMAADATGVDGDAITAIISHVGIYLSLASFAVQVGLTSRIHRSLGIVVALLLLPVGLGASGILILLTGTLLAAGAARVLDTTLRYSLDKTTREVLFLPMPADLRFRAKPFIDVTMDRVAKAAGAVLILVLIQPWGLGLDWRELSYASLALTGAWIAMAFVAWREYLRAFRASIGSRAIAPDTIRGEVSDPASIETLVEELANPDESAVLYAMEMLEALDKRNLITPLLLQHPSPRVRAKTLRALSLSTSPIAGRWISTVEHMLQDQHVDVRAAALHALAVLAHEDATQLMRRHLSDAEPRVAVTAAIGLADTGQPADGNDAEAAFTRLIADRHDTGAVGRAEAAAALAHVENPRFRPLLVPLLHDHDPRVVEHAIASARRMGVSDGLFVPGLLSRLGHRTLKTHARDALVGYGPAILPALAHVLGDRREQRWIRRHVPVTLARIGGADARDALLAALDDADPFLRFKAIVALETLRRHDVGMTLPRAVIETAAVEETSRYYDRLTLRQNVLQHAVHGSESLLVHAIEDKLRQSLDRTYRLLGLLYRADDVAAARYTIEHGGSRQRAAALEYLDNLLGGVLRKRVMPMLDETPLSEKVRFANSVLRSRPRDLDDSLAQLIHDDDAVIAASAVHFVGRHEIMSLDDDLEYVAAHGSSEDGFLLEAVAWARFGRHAGGPLESLPVVELVNRLRGVPLFVSLSVDELFRIAETGQEVRHPAGRELCRAGNPVEDVFCLLEGQLELVSASGGTRVLGAPAIVNLEDTLEGTPLRHDVRAATSTIGFRISADAFLTMASDNPSMTQDLFALLLESHQARAPFALSATPTRPDVRQPAGPMDAVRLLRQDRVFASMPGGHLMALAEAGTEVSLRSGETLFGADSPPTVYLILHGEVQLESETTGPVLAAKGTTIGVTDTLAGTSSGWRATVIGAGRALRLTRDELFGVMTDDVGLMQGMFGRALALRPEAAADLGCDEPSTVEMPSTR